MFGFVTATPLLDIFADSENTVYVDQESEWSSKDTVITMTLEGGSQNNTLTANKMEPGADPRGREGGE